MLEKIIMADLPAEFAATAEQVEHYPGKTRLLHKIELCDQRLKFTHGHSRIKFELMLYAYLTQLGLMEEPCQN